VTENIAGVLEGVVRALGEHRPPPEALRASTSPQGGGGK
jgi:hypothetical protein